MLLYVMVILYLYNEAQGSNAPQLLHPGFGNFGDETSLKCEQVGYDGSDRYNWMVNGTTKLYTKNTDKYHNVTQIGDSFSLIILNTRFSDEGDYKCNYNFSDSNTEQLLVESKGLKQNTKFAYIDGNISVSLQRIYPLPMMSVYFENNTEILGTITDSTKDTDGLYNVVWMSPQVIMAGDYTFRINVITLSNVNFEVKHTINMEAGSNVNSVDSESSDSTKVIVGAVIGTLLFKFL